jgi:hypothetical protein
MDVFSGFASIVDRLDPDIVGFLDNFSDEHVPLRLSFAIVAAALVLLTVLAVWGSVAFFRLAKLRRALRPFQGQETFAQNFTRIDRALATSIVGAAWVDYRECLKLNPGRVLYPRRPDEYIGLHAIPSANYPARFFAAAHGYFIGVGLLLTFVGLVAALKFAAAGVASADLAIAKEALNALLSAASFKFMTSIAGLGCSLTLSVASRIMTYMIEGQAQGLAADLEANMAPIVAESVAYDQLAATREQLAALRQIGATLAKPAVAAPVAAARPEPSPVQNGFDAKTLQGILTTFATEMRGSAGKEMKALTGTLAEVGHAIGGMQGHIDQSGQAFADQLNLAASSLLNAAITLQESVDRRVDRVGDRIDALADIFAKSESMFAGSAQKAAQNMAQSIKTAGDEIAIGVAQATKSLVMTSDSLAQRLNGVLGGFDHFNQSLQSQMVSMQAIVGSLDSAKQVLDESAGIWVRSTAPVIASVDASRRVAAELGQVADRVSSTQHDMTEMAKAVTRLTDKASSVWDNYRNRFEKVDDDLQGVFERLQGGTRAFGKEVMEFVGELDASLAEGMNAFSAGTEELRKVAEILVVDVKAKAA